MKKYAPLILMLSVSYGCAPAPVLPAYGDAVRSMVYHQIAHPETIANPDQEPVTGLSGPRGETVLKEHNANAATAQEAGDTINLNIGK